MNMTLGFSQFSRADLIQPLQGWTPRPSTQGRPCWANPGLYDSNPFGVAEFAARYDSNSFEVAEFVTRNDSNSCGVTEFATLKGWPSFSPGLRGTSYPGFTAIRANPEGVGSMIGGNP